MLCWFSRLRLDSTFEWADELCGAVLILYRRVCALWLLSRRSHRNQSGIGRCLVLAS